MRIWHLVPTGNWAGTEETVLDMANRSAVDGHDVVVVLKQSDRVGEKVGSRFDHRVTVEFATEWESPGDVAARLIKQLVPPDLLHAHLRPGLEVAWRLRDVAPVLAHLHVRFFTSQHWWVDGVAAVARWQMDDIPNCFQGPVFHVPNSIPSVDLASREAVARDVPRLLGGADTYVFGVVGRLSEEKGVDTAIRAFRKTEAPHLRLKIVGDGAELPTLLGLAEDDNRIDFVGYIPAAARYLAAFDALVSPSRLDSFGLSLLQAMAAGLPVTATGARGPSELLNGQPATVVPIDDYGALSEAMLELSWSGRRGPGAVEYDLSDYDPAVVGRYLNDAYDALVAGMDGSR